jgi:hypothetical protein
LGENATWQERTAEHIKTPVGVKKLRRLATPFASHKSRFKAVLTEFKWRFLDMKRVEV